MLEDTIEECEIMKELLRKRIKEMTAIVGVSGHEWDVARYIKGELDGHVDSIEVRPNGVLIASKKGTKPGPRIMVSAHMDEVGYIVKSISPTGFLFFDKIGGATEACIPGRRVLVKGDKGVVPGIFGVRSGHLLTAEEMARPQTVSQSYVDICVNSREEAESLGISTGAQIVIDSPCQEMLDTDYLSTRAADCRILCAIIVETMKKLMTDEIRGEVFAVFSTLEETTVNGIASAVNYLNPDYGVFLDTIPSSDVPDCDFTKELPISLNQGPVIVVSQQYAPGLKYAVSHPKLIQAVRKSGKDTDTKYQEFAFNGAGYVTDAVGAVNAGNGMAVITMSVPRRYSHSPVEVFNMNDVVDTQKIIEDFLRKDVDLTMV